NLTKTQALVFCRRGRITKFDKFTWNGTRIQTVKEYSYLGVLFNNTGTFTKTAEYQSNKGLSAIAATISILRRPKIFNLATAKKLFEACINPTSLYGAEIWGLMHADTLEKVQQSYYKRLLWLPISTPRYFVRLETASA